jgi:hypothetical protein
MKGKYLEFFLSFTGGLFSGIAIAYLFDQLMLLNELNQKLSFSNTAPILITLLGLFALGYYLTKKWAEKKLFDYYVSYASGLVGSFIIEGMHRTNNMFYTIIIGIIFYIIAGFIVVTTNRKQE